MKENKFSVTLDSSADRDTQCRYAAFFFLYFGYSVDEITHMLKKVFMQNALTETEIRVAIMSDLDRYQLKTKNAEIHSPVA